jgi:PiT family inorganic phosphate transporter
VIGSTIAAAGGHAVLWHGLTSKVVIPAVLSPIIAALVAATGTWLLYRISRSLTQGARSHGFRIGQIGSACMVSLAHGTNDAQKTMGVITLALIAYYSGVGHWSDLNSLLHVKQSHGFVVSSTLTVPIWVKIICALAIAGGTASGGWRIINTMGNRITDVESPQGFAAETASAAVILSSSYYGYPLSTTHVVSGGVIGSGVGRRAAVHWGVAGQMATGWIFTIPAAGAVAAIAWSITDLFGSGSAVGGIVIALILAACAAGIFYLAGKKPITADELDRTEKPAAPAPPAPPVAVA